jgi:hypothetical protein
MFRIVIVTLIYWVGNLMLNFDIHYISWLPVYKIHYESQNQLFFSKKSYHLI